VPHQIYARLGSLLFLFKMLLEAYLPDTLVAFYDERVSVSVIGRMLASKVIAA